MQEGSQFGPYTLVKRVAFGGMAEIHLAKTSGIGGFEKLLALKVIHPKYSEDQEFIDMLIDEAKIAVQLSHVNVCQTFDLGRVDNIYYIALEFIDGKDLYQLLVKCSERDITIPLDLVAFIGMEMAAGLHYAHTKGDNYGQPLSLIHRDVSPQNVLVSYDGEVKIVDFGIAKAAKRSRETESGVIKGKFFYMSPEQAWGDQIDCRTDIFSSGICLYEMIAGEMLYHEEKALLLLDKVRKAEIPNMRVRRRDLPQQLEQIVLKALTRDRDRRYQTAGELHAALSGFLYGNWPNFNRDRLKEFMRHVFGDVRFVLPKPAPAAKARVPQMGLGDLASGHSVIFDLNEMDRLPAPKPSSPPKAAPRPQPAPPAPKLAPPPVRQVPVRPVLDAGFDEGEPTAAVEGFDSLSEPTGPIAMSRAAIERAAAQPMVPMPPLGGDDDDDEEEHTILENVWSDGQPPPSASSALEGDDSDRTAILGGDIVDQLKQAGIALHEQRGDESEGEDPTSLFSRGGDLPPIRGKGPTARAPVPDDDDEAPIGEAETVTLEPTPLAPTPAPPARPALRVPSAPNPPAPKPAPSPPAPKPAPSPPMAPPRMVPTDAPPVPRVSEPPAPRPKPPGNRAGEAARPTMMAMPAQGVAAKPAWKKIVTPVGVTIVVLVLLAIYAGYQLLPGLLAPDKPKVVTAEVTSTPSGAEIFLDGTDTGKKTPAKLEALALGSNHSVKLTLAGFDDVTEALNVPMGEQPGDGEVKRRLFLSKKKGKLDVSSVPDHAELYVDGKFTCETPCTVPDLDRDKNDVRLLLRKDGYRDYPDVVRWGEEVGIKVEYKLSPREK